MQIDLHIDGLEDGLSKTPGVKPNRKAIKSSINESKHSQYAEKPKETAAEKQGSFLDLSVIGNEFAKFITKKSGHHITSNDIKILYLSGGGDAIAFCQLQYDFYEKKDRVDLTPIYLYMGRDNKVMKLPFDPNTGNFDLGTVGQFVEALNNDGYNFRHAIDLVIR